MYKKVDNTMKETTQGSGVQSANKVVLVKNNYDLYIQKVPEKETKMEPTHTYNIRINEMRCNFPTPNACASRNPLLEHMKYINCFYEKQY